MALGHGERIRSLVGMGPGWLTWWRPLLLIVALVIGALVLISSGLVTRLVPWLGIPESWRADRIAETSVDDTEVVRLREQVIRLNAENLELQLRLRDYDAIAGEGGMQDSLSVLRRVRVLGRSHRPSERYVTIDAGAYDGIEVGNAVLAGWTLVGTIAGEEPGRSLVRLVTDRDSRVPAHLVVLPAEQADAPDSEAAGETVQPQVLALGVLAGTGARDVSELRFVEDLPDLEVVAGMAVVTAGGPGTIPPGLVLGTVTEASLPEAGDHWHITVQPVRRGDLESSLVVLRQPAPAVLDQP